MGNLKNMSYADLRTEAKLVNVNPIGKSADVLREAIEKARKGEVSKKSTSTTATPKAKKEKAPSVEKPAKIKVEKAEVVKKSDLPESWINSVREIIPGAEGEKDRKVYHVKRDGKAIEPMDFKDPKDGIKYKIEKEPFDNLQDACMAAEALRRHLEKEDKTIRFRFKYLNPKSLEGKKESSKKTKATPKKKIVAKKKK